MTQKLRTETEEKSRARPFLFCIMFNTHPGISHMHSVLCISGFTPILIFYLMVYRSWKINSRSFRSFFIRLKCSERPCGSTCNSWMVLSRMNCLGSLPYSHCYLKYYISMIHVPALEILAEGSQMTPSSKWINHSHTHATGATPCHTSTTRPVPSPFIWYEEVSTLPRGACSASVAFRLQQAHDVERSTWRIILLNADGVTNEGTRSLARIVDVLSRPLRGQYQMTWTDDVVQDIVRLKTRRCVEVRVEWRVTHRSFTGIYVWFQTLLSLLSYRFGVKTLLLITACQLHLTPLWWWNRVVFYWQCNRNIST